MESTSYRDLRQDVDVLIEMGASLPDVEREVIAPSPVSEDEKAALWLYCWSRADEREAAGTRA